MTSQNPSLFKSRSWITGMFVFGILLLGTGLTGLILMPSADSNNLALSFISFGFILTLLAGFRLNKGEKSYLQDERTKKIGAYGLSWSWFLTFIVLFGIFWADYLHLWSLDASALSVFLILLMGISAKAFQIYLFRKGDVE